MFLQGHYVDDIQFSPSTVKNQSLLVFSSKLTIQDVVEKVRSINVIRDAASTLRSVFMRQTFDLDNKYCDAEELRTSWDNTILPDKVKKFFSNFFNITKSTLLSNSLQNLPEPDIE